MLNEYKNIIFENLKESGLGIDKFYFDEKGQSYSVIFKDEEVNLVFTFINLPQSFDRFNGSRNLFAPGYPKQPFEVTDGLNFNEVYSEFVRWYHSVINRYIQSKNTPDLWAEYLKTEKLLPIKPIDYKDLQTFTHEEKQTLQLTLNELKVIVTKKFELDAIHQHLVEERLNYLGESLERNNNKTDWKGILINTIISITIALSLDAQKGQELYNLFIQVMQVAPALSK